MDILLSTYCDMILSIKTGSRNGQQAISKPLLVYSIILAIDVGHLKENKIQYPDIVVQAIFGALYCRYYKIDDMKFLNSQYFIRPFFHLDGSDFYSLVWKEGVKFPSKSTTPSGKFLRENLLYAKLDDGLWGVLEVEENREYIKEKIKERYFNELQIWQQNTMTS